MPRREIRTKLVGVTFDNPDGTNRQEIIRREVRKGMKLVAVPEPDNPVDPNAITVCVRYRFGRSSQVGYLSASLARDLAGMPLAIEVLEVTGGKSGKVYGVNVRVTEQATSGSGCGLGCWLALAFVAAAVILGALATKPR